MSHWCCWDDCNLSRRQLLPCMLNKNEGEEIVFSAEIWHVAAWLFKVRFHFEFDLLRLLGVWSAYLRLVTNTCVCAGVFLLLRRGQILVGNV